jgi:hypothetical protein
MRRIHWLHGVAALWLIAAGLAGIGLVLHFAWIPSTAVDCPRAPCRLPGHPFVWIGVLVLIVAIVGTVILFRIETNLKAGRTVAGYPRA